MNQISLLWPDQKKANLGLISKDAIRDLELESIVQAMCQHTTYHESVRKVLYQLCQDPETIQYRQTVLRDMQANAVFSERLKALIPLLDELTQFTFLKRGRGSLLQDVAARARELELLVTVVETLNESFTAVSTPLQSTGLLALQTQTQAFAQKESFKEMTKALPPMINTLRSNASITIGVNLDERLRPEAAVLLSVNQEQFTESTFLEQLFGKGNQEGKGIAQLHRPPVMPQSGSSREKFSPLMVPLFKDLAKVLEKVAEPIAEELKRFTAINGRFLAELRPELIFYSQAYALIERLQSHDLRLSFPEIVSAEARVCSVKDAYNLLLGIQQLDAAVVVTNNIEFGENGRIAILTGPNQGGKTTFMQAVGLVYVMAQAGLPVPGKKATLSPIDAIYTHYPIEEQLALGTGRFGDEAKRIRAIFEKVTQSSLVLLNESLATTSLGEGTFVAQDIVKAFRQIGLCAIFTTHMHELATAVDDLNAAIDGDSKLFSLVASKPEADIEPDQKHSYTIQSGPPIGRSYADHIATQYGISGEQLQALINERNFKKGNQG
ncbi:MAG: hypothetical protein AAF490_21755 [Chloroflexota bacterium]